MVFYLFLLVSSLVISLMLAVMIFRRRHIPGAYGLILVISLTFLQILGFILEWLNPSLEGKLFWDNFQFVPLILLPLANFAFVFGYTQRKLAHPRWTIAGLMILPIAALAEVFSNHFQGGMRASAYLIQQIPLSVLHYDLAFQDYFTTGYLYLYFLSAIFILYDSSRSQSRLFQIQTAILISGFLIPLAGGILTITGFQIGSLRDFTPVTFTISELILAFGLQRFSLLEIAPIARDAVLEKMHDAVIVVDSQGRILDVNPAAQNLLGMNRKIFTWQKMSTVLHSYEELFNRPESEEFRVEISTPPPVDRCLEVISSPLFDKRSLFYGRILLFHDISERKRLEQRLLKNQEFLEERVAKRTAELAAANRELQAEILEREKAEAGIAANNRNLEVLYQMALDLANLPQDNDLFEFLAYRLKEIAGAQLVILTEYEPKGQCLETRYITMDEEVLAELSRLLNFDIKQLSMPYSGQFQKNLLKKSVIFEPNIFEASLELVPQPVSDILHQTFGIGEVIVLAQDYQGHLLGAALLFMSIGCPRPAEKMLLALSRVATIAFRKRSAELARLESENRFREFAELVPQPVLEYSLEGQITFASRKTFQNLGYSREDLEAGLNILNMVKASDRALVLGKLRRLAGGESLFGNEYTLLSKDARQVPVLAYSSPVLTGQQVTGARTVLIDISDRKAAEQVLERYARRMEMLHQIDYSILSSHSAEEIAQAALNGIKKMVPITVAHIFLVDSPAGPIRTLAQDGASDQGACPLLNSPTSIDWDQEGYNHRPAVTIRSCTCKIRQSQSLISIPLRYQHRQVGAMVFCMTDSMAIQGENLEIAQEIGNQLAIAIQQSDLFNQTQKALERERKLNEITRSLSSTLSLEASIPVFLRLAAGLTGADGVLITLLTPDGNHLVFPSGYSYPVDINRHPIIARGEGLSWRVLQTLKPISIDDYAASPYAMPEWVNAGLRAFLCVPLLAGDKGLGILVLYQRKEGARFDQRDLDLAEAIGRQAGMAIRNAQLFEAVHQTAEDLEKAYDATIEGWARALELRDRETRGHSERVTRLALQLAQHLGLSSEELVHFKRGVFLHDIGKMGIPDQILNKPGPLTVEELTIMRQHPVLAYQLLSGIEYLRPALDIPYAHHEKWDGSGYPRGLKGEDIPLHARIFTVVDVWDALLSDRPYRATPWSKEATREYLAQGAGSLFDPRIVAAFLEIIEAEG